MDRHVPLNRLFSPIRGESDDIDEVQSAWGFTSPSSWDELEREFRCVILAEAGAGKTEELKLRACHLGDQGKPSFFIRIEDIENDFYEAFEVGDEDQFHAWRQSTEEAWFFLDSIDEARLESPRALRKALRRFAMGIRGSEHRAHIYLSSRPYAWHPKADRKLFDESLFLRAPSDNNGDSEQPNEVVSALKVYTMLPLDTDRIRLFSAAQGARDIEGLLTEIDRTNLWSLAERPFDLEGILIKWNEDHVLGSRLDLLRHNIDTRLRDDHNIDRAQLQPLNLELAKEGARCLAAAVVLSGKPGLNVPDSIQIKPGIDAESVLVDWRPQEVRALLERGIFNDIIYGAVRFRHREVLELLAAEWFDGLLRRGGSRTTIEALFFREQYGEKIVTPRLRSILPWLILFDDAMRLSALQIIPELAVEGGDPSRLPLRERQEILANIVRRIATNEDGRTARDHSAIARIANPELSPDTLQLINTYRNNDDAIFFLGRLAWQGNMSACIHPLAKIAVDPTRGIYARIASVRAVLACGSVEDKRFVWRQINESDSLIPRQLLAEILDGAEPELESVEQFLSSLRKLPPFERFTSTGLRSSIHNFIGRLSIDPDAQNITQIIDGFLGYLETDPYIERGECQVSEKYAWLLGPAAHAAERLIEQRNPASLETNTLSILLMVPALRFWNGSDFNDYKDNLSQMVPAWPELNDALYWASIDQARRRYTSESAEPLIDDRLVSWLGHFWRFDESSLPRLLDFIRSRPSLEDKLVALSTAFRVYLQADSPENILRCLEEAATGYTELRDRLNTLLNPPITEATRRYEERQAEFERTRAEEDEQRKLSIDAWIASVCADPNRIRNPPNLEPNELSSDQYWLLHELLESGITTIRSSGKNWQQLIPKFGEEVAQAYRDAAINYWRHYTPTLQSEGDIRDNSIPYALIFALAGLEIESSEVANFPNHLSESLVNHALRYITWELNGFPNWLEKVHKAFPALTESAVIQELTWELDNSISNSEQPRHYIIYNLAYHAPWLHIPMARVILEWLFSNNAYLHVNRGECLRILIEGGTENARLIELALQQIGLSQDHQNIAYWYSLLVDCDPDTYIPEIEHWLSELVPEDAVQASQIFITALIGNRHSDNLRPQIGKFRTANHLKSLYILMHRYIRVEDDVNRAGSGVYSPDLRDEAQEARNRLFNLLSECPGKDCYFSLKALAAEHPDHGYRPWMAKQAYKRAEEDGDLEPWSAEQVNQFSRVQTIVPATHRQLFDLTVCRLKDLKNWLEQGNDSPWQTWQRAEGETETRTLIAGWLNQRCRDQYTTAQEPELANSQRMDIWLQNTHVQSPVPIELKLLDKGWSGPELCERLRNQLAGDYLREETAGCGVFLLVSQNIAPNRRWKIDRRRPNLNALSQALKDYWQNIADEYPGVAQIDIVVIDLAKRGLVSDS